MMRAICAILVLSCTPRASRPESAPSRPAPSGATSAAAAAPVASSASAAAPASPTASLSAAAFEAPPPPSFRCGGGTCARGREVCCVTGLDAGVCRAAPAGAGPEDERWSRACTRTGSDGWDTNVFACTDSGDCADSAICCATDATPATTIVRCAPSRACVQVEFCESSCKTPGTRCQRVDVYPHPICVPSAPHVRCGDRVCAGSEPVCRFDSATGRGTCVGPENGGGGGIYQCTSRADCGGGMACVGERDGQGGTFCSFAALGAENSPTCERGEDCGRGARCMKASGGPGGLKFCSLRF